MPAWIQVALAAVGAITSIMGGNKAAHAARRQAREEARMEGVVTAEKIRQIGKQEVITKGETIAGYAGSGVKVGRGQGFDQSKAFGSPLTVLAEQAREFARERHIVSEVGASKAAQALGGGRSIADQYKFAGYSQAASNIADIFKFWPSGGGGSGGSKSTSGGSYIGYGKG